MLTDKDGTFSVGVWIELPPRMALRGEGIFRTLVCILRPLVLRPDVSVVLAAPRWTEAELKRLLRDHGIESHRVRFVFSRRRIPWLVRFYDRLLGREPKGAGLLARILQRFRRIRALRLLGSYARTASQLTSDRARSIFLGLVSSDSILAAGLAGLLLALLLVLMLPFALAWLGFRTVLGRGGIFARALAKFRARVVGAASQPTTPLQQRFAAQLRKVHEDVIDREFSVLARRARKQSDVKVWFVPHPGAAHAREIGQRLVVAVPDIVYFDFPTVFDASTCERLDKKIATLLPHAKAVISYSEFVRGHHVIRQAGVAPERAVVLPHAPMLLDRFLEIVRDQFHGNTRAAAVALVRDLTITKADKMVLPGVSPAGYLANFPFDEVPFLFVASQVRPHKNFPNLLRAFERLVRRADRPLKLVLTARMEDQPALRDQITEAGLGVDVLPLADLPVAILGALYNLASLTVVPTLFEGGFPFPFSESLSVGTPVVLSSMPVTREVVPDELAKMALFDPYNVDDMVEKIHWGLENRDQLLEKERELFNRLSSRTWDAVADDYLDVFRSVSAGRL